MIKKNTSKAAKRAHCSPRKSKITKLMSMTAGYY